MGTGVSRAVAGKPSGASDRNVSRADPAGRAKAAREAAGKPAGAGVPLTVSRQPSCPYIQNQGEDRVDSAGSHVHNVLDIFLPYLAALRA
jgi:hypothetical protein